MATDNNKLLEKWPEKQAGQLFLLGGIFRRNDIPWICKVVETTARCTADELKKDGFQIVGYIHLVPAQQEGKPLDALAVRLVVHYVGVGEAAKIPRVLPENLPAGMIHDGLDSRILESLKLSQRWVDGG